MLTRPLTLTVLSPNPDPCAAWVQQPDITMRPLPALPHAPWLPPYTPPVLLNSVDYQSAPLLLCRLLDRFARRPADPVLALLDPADRCAHTLFHHSPNVIMILGAQFDPTLLATVLELAGFSSPAHLTPNGPVTMGFAPPLPALPALPALPLALPTLFTVLAEADAWTSAAHRLGFSPRHLRRLQCATAAALGCPPQRLGPRRWVDQVLAALATGGACGEDCPPLERIPTP